VFYLPRFDTPDESGYSTLGINARLLNSFERSENFKRSKDAE
jgi:hypothetical protein